MGIYSSNRFLYNTGVDYASQIPANEAYDAAFGCAHVLADCQANDMALFESAIYDDMQEVMSIHEGTEIINENAFTDVIKKIIEMFKKLIAKIKGIFKSFIAKLNGVFKSGKDMVKQYEKQIIKYANWKDFKVKGIRKPSSHSNSNLQSAIDTLFAIKISNEYHIPYTNETDWPLKTTILEKTAKEIDDMDSDDLKTHIIDKGGYLNGVKISEMKDISEQCTEYLFEDEDTLDGDDDKISGSYFSAHWIKDILNDDKWVSNTEKKNKNCEDKINKIIDDLKKIDDKIAKEVIDKKIGDSDRVRVNTNDLEGIKLAGKDTIGKDDHARSGYKDFSLSTKNPWGSGDKAGKDSNTDFNDYAKSNPKSGYIGSTYGDIQKYIHALQKVASNEQEVITKVTAEYMSQVKFAIAQAKKIWTAAAAWSSTTHKEHVSYYTALGESAAEEFYMDMESI